MPTLIALPPLPVPPYWIALLICALYAGALWGLDAYTPPEVRHWQRLARLRGLQGTRDLGERVGERIPVVGRLREELDIRLLLAIAGSAQTTESWLVGTAAYALGAGAILAAADGVALTGSGALPLPLWVVVAMTGVVAGARYLVLRNLARARQLQVGDQLSDALLGLAVLVPGIPPEDALSLLARCQRDGKLTDVLEEHRLIGLLGVDASLKSTRERYLLIGQALRIPMFQELGHLMRGIETEGLNPREEYPALSRISAQNRLALNRLRAARAKTGAAAAIALLLVPLLIMVGGGIAFAFLGAVNG